MIAYVDDIPWISVSIFQEIKLYVQCCNLDGKFRLWYEFSMEHYRKKRIRFYEAEALPNEIKITNSGRTQEIATKAARKLKVMQHFLL